GWDKHFGFQLYKTDPSGNYGGWKATSIGAGHQQAMSGILIPFFCQFLPTSSYLVVLKSDYKEGVSMADALLLGTCYLAIGLQVLCLIFVAAKVLSKTMDSTQL